jgi:galactitol-specific phosphotransferase system IIB component
VLIATSIKIPFKQMNFMRQFSSSLRTALALLLVATLLSACGGGSSSSASDQTQVSTLQTQLAAVQAQLASAQAQGQVDSTAIATAITSLTQTQSALAQLVA